MLRQLTEEVGKAFVFDKMRPGIRSYFLKAGISEVPYVLFGSLFWLSLIPVALIFMFKGWDFILGLNQFILIDFFLVVALWTLLHGVIVTLIILVIYFYMDLVIFGRTKKMEAVLPEFLRLVSENLKGGMSFDRALWSSIRPEFGVLSEEIRLTAKKVITGESSEDALRSFNEKYDSLIMRRSFDLIIEGMKGGGRIADIIDSVIKSIYETRELKEEMAATSLSYIIFIVIIVVIVTPGLFTLSFQFMGVLASVGEKIESSTGGEADTNLPINLGGISFDPSAFRSFSTNALIVVSFFASLMISMIQKGSIKAGVKYIPILVVSSQIVYRVLMFAAGGLFSGFAI